MVQGIVATGLEDFKALPFAHVANLKPSSPLRPPSWRWERAMALRQSGRGLSRTRDDDCVLTSPLLASTAFPPPGCAAHRRPRGREQRRRERQRGETASSLSGRMPTASSRLR